MLTLGIESTQRCQMIDITGQVVRVVSAAGIRDGTCCVYVPHTTAAVTINENADPSVVQDIIRGLDRLVPRSGDYSHAEGNADAHIKASLIGSSVTIPVENGLLALGRWQGVFFCEFDGPRLRKAIVSVVSGQ